MLAIDPTDSTSKDLSSKYKHRREYNLWEFSTKHLLESTDNIEHIQLVLSVLSGKESLLGTLRKDGCTTDIFCFWESSGQGGPILDIELMRKLVRYGLDISWDMYYDEENA